MKGQESRYPFKYTNYGPMERRHGRETSVAKLVMTKSRNRQD